MRGTSILGPQGGTLDIAGPALMDTNLCVSATLHLAATAHSMSTGE